MNEKVTVPVDMYQSTTLPTVGEVVTFVTNAGEYCLGVYDKYAEWVDWASEEPFGTQQVAWWWYVPTPPKGKD